MLSIQKLISFFMDKRYPGICQSSATKVMKIGKCRGTTYPLDAAQHWLMRQSPLLAHRRIHIGSAKETPKSFHTRGISKIFLTILSEGNSLSLTHFSSNFCQCNCSGTVPNSRARARLPAAASFSIDHIAALRQPDYIKCCAKQYM